MERREFASSDWKDAFYDGLRKTLEILGVGGLANFIFGDREAFLLVAVGGARLSVTFWLFCDIALFSVLALALYYGSERPKQSNNSAKTSIMIPLYVVCLSAITTAFSCFGIWFGHITSFVSATIIIRKQLKSEDGRMLEKNVKKEQSINILQGRLFLSKILLTIDWIFFAVVLFYAFCCINANAIADADCRRVLCQALESEPRNGEYPISFNATSSEYGDSEAYNLAFERYVGDDRNLKSAFENRGFIKEPTPESNFRVLKTLKTLKKSELIEEYESIEQGFNNDQSKYYKISDSGMTFYCNYNYVEGTFAQSNSTFLRSLLEIDESAKKRVQSPKPDSSEQTASVQAAPQYSVESKSREDDVPRAGDAKKIVIAGKTYVFRYCPKGSFSMGSATTEKGRYLEEVPHNAKVDGFWIMENEVSRELWFAVMDGAAETDVESPRLPICGVDHDQCQTFIEKLNKSTLVSEVPTGWEFRLPTETEWEYACRAGKTTPFNTGERLKQGEDANYRSSGPRPVEAGKPNAWELRNMHGNVFEWCADYYSPRFYEEPKSKVDNPRNDAPYIFGDGYSRRVCRGGGWNSPSKECRSAFRYGVTPKMSLEWNWVKNMIGLRLVLNPKD